MPAAFQLVGLRQPHGQHQRGLAFQGQIGQHRAHQWLLGQPFAKRLALPCIGQRLHRGLAQDGGAAQHAAQPGGGGHLDDGGNAAPFLAHQDAPGVRKLDLAARVAAVAHLVLEALHVHRVLAAIGPPARHKKAGVAALGRARHHQVRVAHRRREKPFMPAQEVFAPAPAHACARTQRCGQRGIGAHVRAALLFGHAHAQPDRALLRQRHIARVVVVAEQLGLQLRPQRGLLLQHRNAGRGHGGRAQRALLDLAVQVKARGPRRPPARALVLKRLRDQTLRAVQRHQRVPARVELHRVGAAPARIKAVQLGRVAVRLLGEAPGFLRAQLLAIGRQLRLRPKRARALQGFAQGGVGAEQVEIGPLVELVENLVRGPGGHGVGLFVGELASASRHDVREKVAAQASQVGRHMRQSDPGLMTKMAASACAESADSSRFDSDSGGPRHGPQRSTLQWPNSQRIASASPLVQATL